jgi:hypothetical protein
MTATRAKTYRDAVLENAREAVLDIPDIALLEFRKPDQIVGDFFGTWRSKPSAVVLPIMSADGVNFDNPCELPLSRACQASVADEEDAPVSFLKSVYGFAELGCDIYLSLVPNMSFVQANPLFLVDSVGDTSFQTCISKEGIRDILSELLAESIMLALTALRSLRRPDVPRLRGVVFDLVSIWPMGANDGRLELTCFCESCVPRLEQIMQPTESAPVSDLLGHFRDFPSPANLLLSDTGAAISYVERVTSSMTARQVVALCKMKGFDQVWKGKEDTELTNAAQYLMSYLRARHRLTVEVVQNIFTRTIEIVQQTAEGEDSGDSLRDLSCVFLLEGDPYDWTSGLFLDALDSSGSAGGVPACDELWFDPTSVTPVVQNLKTRSYMWRRSRYLIDSMFDTIASISSDTIRAATGWARYSDEIVQQMLDNRRRTAVSGRMEGLSALRALGPEANRVGFVGVGLNDDTLDSLIRATRIAKGRYDNVPRF